MTDFAALARTAYGVEEREKREKRQQQVALHASKCFNMIRNKCIEWHVDAPESPEELYFSGPMSTMTTYVWGVEIDTDVILSLSTAGYTITKKLVFEPWDGCGLGYSAKEDPTQRYVEFKTLVEAGSILSKIEEGYAR